MTHNDQTDLLRILTDFDLAAFREATGAVDATDDEVLEAIHRTRLGMTDLHWRLRVNSKRWLNVHGTGV